MKELEDKLSGMEKENLMLADSLGEIRSELDKNRNSLESATRKSSELESERKGGEIWIGLNEWRGLSLSFFRIGTTNIVVE